MKSAKRILALAAAVVILGLYVITFFLGVFGSLFLVARILSGRGASGGGEKEDREKD